MAKERRATDEAEQTKIQQSGEGDEGTSYVRRLECGCEIGGMCDCDTRGIPKRGVFKFASVEVRRDGAFYAEIERFWRFKISRHGVRPWDEERQSTQFLRQKYMEKRLDGR